MRTRVVRLAAVVLVIATVGCRSGSLPDEDARATTTVPGCREPAEAHALEGVSDVMTNVGEGLGIARVMLTDHRLRFGPEHRIARRIAMKVLWVMRAPPDTKFTWSGRDRATGRSAAISLGRGTNGDPRFDRVAHGRTGALSPNESVWSQRPSYVAVTVSGCYEFAAQTTDGTVIGSLEVPVVIDGDRSG